MPIAPEGSLTKKLCYLAVKSYFLSVWMCVCHRKLFCTKHYGHLIDFHFWWVYSVYQIMIYDRKLYWIWSKRKLYLSLYPMLLVQISCSDQNKNTTVNHFCFSWSSYLFLSLNILLKKFQNLPWAVFVPLLMKGTRCILS